MLQQQGSCQPPHRAGPGGRLQRKPLGEAIELPEDKGQLALELDFEAPCDSGVCFT